MKEIGTQLLSNYEKGIKDNAPMTLSDKATKNRLVRETLREMLNCPIIHTMSDGTEIKGTAMDIICASAIQDAINNPKGFTQVKDMLYILGQDTPDTSNDKSKVIDVNLVDEDLKNRALK